MSRSSVWRRETGLAFATILAFALTSTPGSATERTPARLGYRVGLSLTDLRGFSAEGKSIEFGPGGTAGTYCSFHMSDQFIFQAELNLILRNVRLNYDYNVGPGELQFEETARFYYLEMPLLAKFPFHWKENKRWSVYLGPVWALTLSDRRSGHYASTLDNIPSGDFSGVAGNTETLDFGVAVGWDFHFGAPRRSYMIDLRFTLGLKSVFADVHNPADIPNDQYPFCDPVTGQADEYRSGSFLLSFGFDSPL